MTLSEARIILGLGPEEDPCPYLREFYLVREQLAEWVRDASDADEADRCQLGLMEIDRALAAVREYLDAAGGSATEPVPEPAAMPPSASGWRFLKFGVAGLSLLLLAGAGFKWYRWRVAEQQALETMARISQLDREATEHLLNRRWPEATAAYDEISRLLPGTSTIQFGRRSIEAGMAEEQQQFAAYWNGQARAALEAGRWDDAQQAVREVLVKFPNDRDSLAMVSEIAVARTTAARQSKLDHGRESLNRKEWKTAALAAGELLATQPGDADAQTLLAEANAGAAQEAADFAKARSLFDQARARDQGQFDQQALDWLREAKSLAPEAPDIAALYEKMSAYIRTLRVPEDFPTPLEALAQARDRDRIILAEGDWKGPLFVNTAIDFQGAGPEKTRIECPAEAGCAITLGPTANGARLTGLGFRHVSQTGESERFSVGLIRGAAVDLLDCHFRTACGHGVVVIEGGAVKALRCRFIDNGWNGAAAIGAGTRLEVRDSEATGNFENGIEAWDGAAMTAINNRCEANSRNGIHADTGQAPAVIEGNQLRRNREFGLVLTRAGGGHLRDNRATGNLLGGMVIRLAAPIPATGNQLRDNKGPGLTLELGLQPTDYRNNPLSGNTGKALLADFNFQPLPPAVPAQPLQKSPANQ
jgi:parallel beta-helix repeat protein